ncbi:hypothetical protein R6U76_19920 [Lysinibacillus capsici]|uniref:hypothetical protein n=1 Tax=Lysinibacillus capsici TaxID=2115968 RepID=UPI0029DE7507|nr:hypothetical protein [Lysinibacillus capsici]WPK04868.1 hypothetical protein R6U76_19920 [Lysinibacillus capsici]
MTEMKKLSIHRALTELKMLTLRIEAATNEVSAVVANRKSNRKINGVDIPEYEKQMQASYDKVLGLISYRNKIKALVVQSNANTKVLVGKEEMTVAEAIERKQSIQYEKNLLEVIQHQHRSAINTIAKENDALPAKLETYLINILGNKDKQSSEEVKLHTETFMKRNEFEIIDPLNVKQQIEKLSNRIEEFESEVDAILSESNATTFIEVQV